MSNGKSMNHISTNEHHTAVSNPQNYEWIETILSIYGWTLLTYVQRPNRNNHISNDKNHGDFPLHLQSLAHLARQLLQLRVKPWRSYPSDPPCWVARQNGALGEKHHSGQPGMVWDGVKCTLNFEPLDRELSISRSIGWECLVGAYARSSRLNEVSKTLVEIWKGLIYHSRAHLVLVLYCMYCKSVMSSPIYPTDEYLSVFASLYACWVVAATWLSSDKHGFSVSCCLNCLFHLRPGPRNLWSFENRSSFFQLQRLFWTTAKEGQKSKAWSRWRKDREAFLGRF